MIKRDIEDSMKKLARQFPAILIQGPRQSGKTTIAKEIFQDKPYYNFESPNTQLVFEEDPIGFLSECNKTGAIFDEAQNVPKLFSYLQTKIDEDRANNGRFIITGSSNFLISKNVSQSLAGRCAICTLLPLSITEIKNTGNADISIENLIFKGGYPQIYSQNCNINLVFEAYISTYVEKDIRRTLNIKDWKTFNIFLKLLAGRIGSILEITSLSNDCGINAKTVREWLSILEQSFIIFTLPSWYKNTNKRLVKSPKIYFFDTGLACRLLGFKTAEQIKNDKMKGALFENLIILEKIKENYNNLYLRNYYYYRTSNGVEVDLIEEDSINLNAYEIKSSSTFASDFVKNLIRFKDDYSETRLCQVIYSGENIKSFKGCEIKNFNDM